MIGILTYHFAHNYGAMLQAYALKKYLNNSGFEAEIINYCPEKIKRQYSIGKETITYKNFWWKVYRNIKRKNQYDLFEDFRIKALSGHSEVSSDKLGEYSKKYDAIIAGSDQVWNTSINLDDPNYYLKFANKEVRKIGYAISLGSINMTKNMRELIDQNIIGFDRVSFREKSSTQFLNEVYKKKYPVTCDPVFLLEVDKWNHILKKPESRIPEKFILYYSLHDDENLKSAVKQTAEMEGLPIVSIHPLCKKEKIADLNMNDVGPREFLWLIKNAEYVASNSFHATAFSIIFQKKAIIRPHPVLGDRNKDLLNLIRGDNKLQNGDVYQFEFADWENMNKLVAYSKSFLTDCDEADYKPVDTSDDNHAVILGAKLKNIDKRISCQSGGAATTIAERFIKDGAVVYGCGFDEKQNVVYHRITTLEDLSLLKGSKYVRANLGNTFTNVITDLKNLKKVLFIGNACNIAGIKKAVSVLPEKDNLYTMDFICHGTPSHELYKEYLYWVEKRYKKGISSFVFRIKDVNAGGWKKPFEKILFDDGHELITKEYTDLFYSNHGLRPSCSVCKYSSYKRIADYTVGDFWGIENYNPEFFDNTGVSLVFLNTSRAKELIGYLEEQCFLVQSDVQKCLQPNMVSPSPIPKYRNKYWDDLKKKGFEHSLKRFTSYGRIGFKIRRKIYKYTGYWC